jgi:hypothetical protein
MYVNFSKGEFMNTETAIIISTALGPITAVLITLWHQDRQQKKNAKERLFITLMAHRKSFPPRIEWANALNLIDVVFVDHPKVVTAWHDLYDYLHNTNNIDISQFEYKNTKLLSEISHILGYKNLQQIDIDRFYSPQAHGNQVALSTAIQSEFLVFLRNLQASIATQQKTQ